MSPLGPSEEAPAISPRLARRVRTDFERPDEAFLRLLRITDSEGRALGERCQTAAVLVAEGDLERLDAAIELAAVDWRDLLVAADLAGEGWRGHLDALLGPADG